MVCKNQGNVGLNLVLQGVLGGMEVGPTKADTVQTSLVNFLVNRLFGGEQQILGMFHIDFLPWLWFSGKLGP